MAENKTNLFHEFPPVPTGDWEALIHNDLKGKDYDKTLIWRTYEGIDVKPYYRCENTEELVNHNSIPCEFPFIR